MIDRKVDRANQIVTIARSMHSKKEIIQNLNDLCKQLSIDFTQCFTKNIVSSPDRMVNVSSFVDNIEKKLFKCK